MTVDPVGAPPDRSQPAGGRYAKSLIGREPEFDELWQLYGQARHGQGSVVLLLGEPGIGKTTLLEALTERALSEGARVSWGRCIEAGGQPAWWPFTQALSPWIEDGTLDRKTVEAAGAAVLHLLPEATALVPDLQPLGAPEAATTAFAVARATSRLLRAGAARGPRVVSVDDVHAADPATLRLLSVLATEVRSMPIVILCTLREAEAQAREDVRALIDDVSRSGRVVRVPRLSDDAARALLAQVGGGVPPAVQERALGAAGGNPLFLIEIATLLVAQGHADDTLPVPVGVRETLRSRLAALPEPTRAFLEAVAVLGGEAAAERAAVVASQSNAEAASAAHEGGLLQHAPGGRVRLSHGLVREVIYGDIAPERRAVLHRAAAEVLARTATRTPDLLAEIARHWLAAGDPCIERGIKAALEAAQAELSRARFEDAIATLETARAASEVLDVSRTLRAELWLELGQAYMRVGRVEEGRALCEQVRIDGEELEDPDLLARAALVRGTVFNFGLVDRDLVSALTRAAELRQGRGDALEARVLARLAGAEQPSFNPSAPIARAKGAIRLARKLGDQRTMLHVLHDAMSACMDFENPEERRTFNLELRDLAKRLGEPWFELRALTRLVFDHADLGATAEADALVEALDVLARRFTHPQYQWPVLLLRAMRASFQGRFEVAERKVEEAIALGSDDPRFRFTLFGHRHAALLTAERPNEALDLLASEGARVLDVPGGEALLATLRLETLVRLGDPAGARHAFASALPALRYQDPGINASLAECAAFVGDLDVCSRLSAALAGHGNWFASHGAMWCFVRDPLSRSAGLAAGALGRFDEAVTELEHAAACLRRAGGRAFLARCLADLGDALVHRNDSGDRARADACFAEASALARELGQTGLDSRLAEDRGASSDAARLVPNAPPFSLKREGDFWTLERAGHTLRVKDGRGMRILAKLVERTGEEIHVLDLVEQPGGEVDGGHAGELLDARARAEYRARLIDVREELDEAERMGDLGSLERLRAEAEMLEAELSRAFAFGGRARRAGAATERARSAVTRRVKETIQRIKKDDPELGAHLGFAVKTGVVCSYQPAVDA